MREYLEKQTPAQPFDTETQTLPGAIEPQPVNKKVEEEFWAHPPWDKAFTADFSLAAGASEMLSVRLTEVGQLMTRTASKKVLKVELTGSDVKASSLVLK